ncbi:MAG: glycoside hydrolase family 99-like domain-containing protein [Clostridia bacterium]|nr:glycoside hydrolase family 99-like domain-containing protein [Clostridia bacterium]
MKVLHRLNKLIAFLLAVCCTESGAVFAAEQGNAGYKDTDFLITYARDGQFDAAKYSSWDRNIPFPGEDFSNSNENVSTNVLNDGSPEHPSEAYRALNEIKGGIVTLDFDFSMDRMMDTAYRLLDDKKTLFGVVTRSGGIYLEQPGGELLYMAPCSASYVTGEFTYVVKAVIDFDRQRIVSVQINGKTYAEDKPYANPVTMANGFDISTGKESVGVLTNRRLYISGGYYVYECFWNPGGGLPDDWIISTDTGAASLKTSALRFPDKHSLLLNTVNGAVSCEKKISPVSGNLIFEINTLQTKKRDDFCISLNGGGKTAAAITSDGNSFCYIDESGTPVPFYTYTDNVWYHIKLDADVENSVFDIYLNNKLKVSGIRFDNSVSSVDRILVNAGKNQNSLVLDDIKLYRKRIYENYVSPPEPVKKKDDNTLVCMQMCPLWTEGTHYGWDPIKAASNEREPLLGFYDEGNPEIYDWTIKWMAEHGVDFQFQCVYPVARINFSVPGEPIKNDMVREYNGITEGYMNARYSDMMKFAVILECSTFFKGYQHYNEFFDYYLPFYIEYYLKDDRYMKIDGRPVIGIYSLLSFMSIFDDGTGTESVKRGVEKFRKACMDAGVGNPYIVSNRSTDSNIITMAKQAGLDAVTSYGLGGLATFASQSLNMRSAIENCKSEGIDFWPIATPMRDDIAWRVFSGYSHSGDEFREYLSMMQKEVMDNVPSRLSKKVINMTTWDEYGEGHIIAPTVGRGFEYLDAIRDVLTDGADLHEDEIPSAVEKQRVNRLYVRDRKTVFSGGENPQAMPTDTRIVQGRREKSIPETIPAHVKKGLYFTNPADASKVVAHDSISEITSGESGITVKPGGLTPAIAVNEPLEMDAYDVTYVKLRMKKNPSSGGGWFMWTSDLLPSFSTEQKVYFNPLTDDGSEFADYYIPVGKSVFWKGRISDIRIILGDITNQAIPFEIESIEFLSDETITGGDKLVIDGWVQPAEPGISAKGGTVMVPLRQTLYSAGAESVQCFELTDTYSVKYGGIYSEITLGAEEAYAGGRRISLPAAAYKNSGVVNDEVLVPEEFIRAVLFDKSVTWNEDEKALNIVSASGAEVGDGGEERELIYEIAFGSADAYESAYGLSDMSFGDGKLTATTSSGDSQMRLKVDLQASDVKLIEVKMNTAASQSANFYFITDQDTAWNEFKRSASFTTSPGDNILRMDTLTDLSNWQNKITDMRFDPAEASGQTFTLEYIRFYGDTVKSGIKKDMSPCVSESDASYEWTFSKNTYLDGWEGNKSFGSVKAENGCLEGIITGRTPALMNRSDIGADCADISRISIKYANNTASDKARLYFITDDMPELGEACSFDIEVSPMNGEYAEYVIDTSENINWRGRLLRLVFIPGKNINGSVSIDSISLQYG